jgi:prepilin-type N-terminal cleavage/methylation domain-containing protein
MENKTPLSFPRGHRSAFTLIELLTVIAIIGILAAIIIPVVGRVRDSARASVCASNLRQLSFAMNMYANDNKDHYPLQSNGGTTTWMTAIKSYVDFKTAGSTDEFSNDRSVFQCPSRDNPTADFFSYGMTDYVWWNEWKRDALFRASRSVVPDGRKIILLGDKNFLNDVRLANYDTASPIAPGFRHSDNGKANVVYTNGAVEAVNQAQLFASHNAQTSLWRWW